LDQFEELLEKAKQAISEEEPSIAEVLLTQIILSLEKILGENQKEIAASLQEMAKQIERSGQVDKAMEFKQSTTAIMLRLSMERRRGKQALSPVGPAPQTKPTSTFAALKAMPIMAMGSLFAGVVYVIIPTGNISRTKNLYLDVFKAQESWNHTDNHYPSKKLLALAFDNGPRLVFSQGYDLRNKTTPVFATHEFGAAAIHLEDAGFKRINTIPTPKGPIQLFLKESNEGEEQLGLVRSVL
jgi:hypothetical protein